MGKKVNPIGIRLSLNKQWQSEFHSRKNYSSILERDLTIQKYIKSVLTLKKVFVSDINIKRSIANTYIFIYGHKNPGSEVDLKLLSRTITLINKQRASIQFIDIPKVVLNTEIFYTLKEAKVLIERWRRHYNTVRPHSSLRYRPPAPETARHPRSGLRSGGLRLQR